MATLTKSAPAKFLHLAETLTAPQWQQIWPQLVDLHRQKVLGNDVPPPVSKAEARLLRHINSGPPEEQFAKFRQLTELGRTRDLTAAERASLADVVALLDAYEVRRLRWLTELAKLRGTSVRDLVRLLGLKRPEHV